MSRGTPNTPFRIPPDVKDPAQRRAEREGTTLTAVVMECLRRYGQPKT